MEIPRSWELEILGWKLSHREQYTGALYWIVLPRSGCGRLWVSGTQQYLIAHNYISKHAFCIRTEELSIFSHVFWDNNFWIEYFCFISAQVITALGKIWHPEHFQCVHCGAELGTQNFFERDGAPYCEKDYQQLFSPMCAACGGPILDVSRCVSPAGVLY